jgi:hypothetical protein
LIFSALQKAVFWLAKRGLLSYKSIPFTMQKLSFCNAVDEERKNKSVPNEFQLLQNVKTKASISAAKKCPQDMETECVYRVK